MDDGINLAKDDTKKKSDEEKNDIPMPTTTGSSHHQQLLKPFLVIGTVPIYFQEDWTTGIGGGLWSTGLAMALYLQDDNNSQLILQNLQHLLVRKQQRHEKKQTLCVDDDESPPQHESQQRLSLLELGSGHGLLALCWLAFLQAHRKLHWIDHLVITDTQQHLPLIRRTLDANPHLTRFDHDIVDDEDHVKTAASVQITVTDHEWGVFNDDALQLSTTNSDQGNCCSIYSNNNNLNTVEMATLVRQGRYQFDLIFGSDLAYHPTLYQPLLKSLQVFAKTSRPPRKKMVDQVENQKASTTSTTDCVKNHNTTITTTTTSTGASTTSTSNTKHDTSVDVSTTIIIIGCTMNDTSLAFFDQARVAGFRYERMADHLLSAEFRNFNFGMFCFFLL